MIDPVCLFHGKRRWEHECIVCSLCFRDHTVEECWEDENGQKWDVCIPCKQFEDEGPSHGYWEAGDYD